MSTEQKIIAVNAIAEALKAHASMDGHNVRFDKAAYLSGLPEGITEETIKKIAEHDAIVFPAMVKVAGELAIPYLAKNQEVDSVGFEAPTAGRSQFTGTVYRSREVHTPGSTEVKHVAGAVRTAYKHAGAKGSASVMQSVAGSIAEAAALAFAKK